MKFSYDFFFGRKQNPVDFFAGIITLKEATDKLNAHNVVNHNLGEIYRILHINAAMVGKKFKPPKPIPGSKEPEPQFDPEPPKPQSKPRPLTEKIIAPKNSRLVVILWPLVRLKWEEIISIISLEFPIQECFECTPSILGGDNQREDRLHWENFIVDFYAMSTFPPGRDQYSATVSNLRAKARQMFKHGPAFLTLVVDIEGDSYPRSIESGEKNFVPINPENLLFLKSFIRKKYNFMRKSVRNGIIHTFESHVYTDEILDFIRKKCTTTSYELE